MATLEYTSFKCFNGIDHSVPKKKIVKAVPHTAIMDNVSILRYLVEKKAESISIITCKVNSLNSIGNPVLKKITLVLFLKNAEWGHIFRGGHFSNSAF